MCGIGMHLEPQNKATPNSIPNGSVYVGPPKHTYGMFKAALFGTPKIKNNTIDKLQ